MSFAIHNVLPVDQLLKLHFLEGSVLVPKSFKSVEHNEQTNYNYQEHCRSIAVVL